MAWHLRRTGEARAQIAAEVGPETLEMLLPPTACGSGCGLARPGRRDAGRDLPHRGDGEAGSAAGPRNRNRARPSRRLPGFADDGVLKWRLSQAAEALQPGRPSQHDDRTEFETGPNGAKLNRDDRNAFDQLIRDIGFHRGPNRRGRQRRVRNCPQIFDRGSANRCRALRDSPPADLAPESRPNRQGAPHGRKRRR